MEFFAYCCSGRVPSINISYLYRFGFWICEKFDLNLTIGVFSAFPAKGTKRPRFTLPPESQLPQGLF